MVSDSKFSRSFTAHLETAGFLVMALVAAVGVGSIMGSLIQSAMGTMFLGLGVTIGLSYLTEISPPAL